MSAVLARTGRHRQRYDNHFRLVSGCIPYRLIEGNKDEGQCDIESKIEVLMVSSPNRDDLVFPKGGWEDDETILEAACREAVEEAGVRGKLNEIPLGVWEFRSKSRQSICSMEGACRGYMFALEVTEELEIWPEQGDRHRKWLKVREALRLCRYEWMRVALERFVIVMGDDDKRIETMKEIVEREMDPNVVDCQMISSSLPPPSLTPPPPPSPAPSPLSSLSSSSNLCGRPPLTQQHNNQSLGFNFEKERSVKRAQILANAQLAEC